MLGSADVKDHRNLLQPDSSIYHVDARVPVLVLDVGVSQSAKSLEEKAKAWIRTGGGKIRYVFTLKLDGDSQAVYLTTWTPEFVHEGLSTVVKAKGTYQTIRDVTGETGRGAGLVISLDKITPGSCSPESLRHQTITISAEELCEIVKEAEDFEVQIPEATFEDIPTDLVRASSPARSIATDSDHEEEYRDGDEESMATDNNVARIRAPPNHIDRRLGRERDQAAKVVDSL
ncbi:hypothetical protein LTS15_010551 [Exophiala xenobiotica]|nr:hypothetical protein LTS15_010551 [Exophiala xenobiotica]